MRRGANELRAREVERLLSQYLSFPFVPGKQVKCYEARRDELRARGVERLLSQYLYFCTMNQVLLY